MRIAGDAATAATAVADAVTPAPGGAGRVTIARQPAARPRATVPPAYAAVEFATVSVGGMCINADIGVLPHEIGRMQPLIIDVTLELEPRAPSGLADTVDYTSIVEAAAQLGRERIELIETFAHRLAALMLGNPHVHRADVRIDKPNALPNGLAATRVVLGRVGSAARTSSR